MSKASVPLPTRTGAHLAELAAQVHQVELLIGTQFKHLDMTEADFLTGMQKLDYLHQSLMDISELVSQFREPDAHRNRLCEAVRLESTRQLIQDDGRERVQERSAGALDLF
ncbi:hypothetical protein [Pseudosulfitobacter koreensis]|uniref:Chemotaxis protein n=1 Tax=Pseudosulfitobacter koreensis TaxID=2968472 RepID=A0ABT1Z0E2_9RHOB|nr:hypothetical protein [Pseudosulfitobacter koreense]MCR8826610.1 hypothetical protein [Pseudosulfitobacter koreense]